MIYLIKVICDHAKECKNNPKKSGCRHNKSHEVGWDCDNYNICVLNEKEIFVKCKEIIK